MGMFDYLIIDKIHLPNGMEDHMNGWQTKSMECFLDTIEIDKDGLLSIHRADYGEGDKTESSNYTGEIRFYDDLILVGWVDFVALFENGKMITLTRLT